MSALSMCALSISIDWMNRCFSLQCKHLLKGHGKLNSNISRICRNRWILFNSLHTTLAMHTADVNQFSINQFKQNLEICVVELFNFHKVVNAATDLRGCIMQALLIASFSVHF